jgi:hypothetical protein
MLAENFCVVFAFTTFLLVSENTNSKTRSMVCSFINSSFSFCGICYTLLYKYIGNWKYIFTLNLIVNTTIILICIFYSVESPRYYLIKKNFVDFIESLKNIAKRNNKEEEFTTKTTDRTTEESKAYDEMEAFLEKKRSGFE